MDEGLLFWLIIFGIAIAQGIGQRKKKPGSQGAGRKPPGPGSDPATRPSPSGAGERASEPAQVRSQAGPGQEGKADSSEGLVPADVWEEILGLARGELPGPKEPPESPEPPEEEAPYEPAMEVKPAPAPVPAPAPEPGRDLARRGAEEAALQPAPTGLGPTVTEDRRASSGGGKRGGRGVWRDLFGEGTPQDLQKAMVVKEVLGPPVGLREE